MLSGSKGVVPADPTWSPTASPAAANVTAASPNLHLPGPSNPLSRGKLPALDT